MYYRKILIFAFIFFIHPFLPAGGKAALAATLPATVISVHDGDTVRVRLQGRSEKVRLVGIDAPEVERNDKHFRDTRADRRHSPRDLLYLGRSARDLTRSLAPRGARVELEFDVQQRDRYGRLLAYVWVKGAGGRPVMVNAALVEAGLARVMTIPPNVKNAGYFLRLQQKARSARAGLWK